MTNNSITLTAGTWLINGNIALSGNGTYTQGSYVWATANGANSATQPSAVTPKAGLATPLNPPGTTNGNLTVEITTGTLDIFSITPEPMCMAVSTNTTIYLVPYAAGPLVGNPEIQVHIWAYKISTATS